MADVQVTTWLDPWLKLREKTSQRNDLFDLADRYSKMARLARQQYVALKDRPKSSKETLEGLIGIAEFAEARSKPLFDLATKLETELREESERLQNA